MRPMLLKKLTPLVVSAALMAACATKDQNNDPYESFNRGVFDFNYAVDSYLIRPVALGYRYVTPQVVRERVSNVADNLSEPFSMLNAFLQGDFTQGMVSFWRFTINTTIGIGGINDVATTAGLKSRDEDFGQTLAVWGVDSGPYLILPIFGPSNGRDAFGKLAGWFMDPVTYVVDDNGTSFAIAGGKALVTREALLDPIDDIYASSLDPYASFRSIYQQRRLAQIDNLHGADDKTKP